eukprot:6468374-Amphidinium_carterae.1
MFGAHFACPCLVVRLTLSRAVYSPKLERLRRLSWHYQYTSVDQVLSCSTASAQADVKGGVVKWKLFNMFRFPLESFSNAQGLHNKLSGPVQRSRIEDIEHPPRNIGTLRFQRKNVRKIVNITSQHQELETLKLNRSPSRANVLEATSLAVSWGIPVDIFATISADVKSCRKVFGREKSVESKNSLKGTVLNENARMVSRFGLASQNH